MLDEVRPTTRGFDKREINHSPIFRKTYGDALDTLDSDESISREDGGHIYNVYLRFRDGANTGPSIQAIASREREFLRSTGTGTKPLLLTPGPFLLIREPEWSCCA